MSYLGYPNHCVTSWKGAYCFLCVWLCSFKGLKELLEIHLVLLSSHLNIISLWAYFCRKTSNQHYLNNIDLYLILSLGNMHWFSLGIWDCPAYEFPPPPFCSLQNFCDRFLSLFQPNIFQPLTHTLNTNGRDELSTTLKHCPARL